MNNESTQPEEYPKPTRGWFERIGPGLITVCVVIGPGSVLTSSKTGAKYGFDMVWVVLVAVVFMLVYMTLGAKLGVVSGRSAGKLINEKAGRWLAVMVGLGVFLVSASFQFGNNLGIYSAFATYIKPLENNQCLLEVKVIKLRLLFLFDAKVFTLGLMIGFNILTLFFLFGFRNLYSAMERLLTVFVAIMLLAFAVNLFYARPNLLEFVRGVIPDFSKKPDSSVLGLFGTTFVMASAYYQSYLVRQKGWGQKELKVGLTDARFAAGLMAVITLMIMSTAASELRGKELTSVRVVAEQLNNPTFGEYGQLLFCIGLFSAAYSSFLINSMVGGFSLADGLGYPSEATDLPPRIFTAAVLLSGMGVAIYAAVNNLNPIVAIVMGQAVTVLVSPLLAGVLIWLTNCRSVMGNERSGFILNGLAALGFLLILAMMGNTVLKGLVPNLQKLLK